MTCGLVLDMSDGHTAPRRPMQESHGQQIEARRTRLRLTQPDLAQVAGVSVGSVSRIENDKHVAAKTVKKVERALADRERDQSRHGGLTGFGLPQGAPSHVSPPEVVTIEVATLNELASLAYRILALLGTAQPARPPSRGEDSGESQKGA